MDCGSVYEKSPFDGGDSKRTCGSTTMLERMGFKSTGNRTYFRLVRELEAIGAVPSVFATREQMSYTVDCVRTQMGPAVEILLDGAANPAFFGWEVKEQADLLLKMLAMEKDPASAELYSMRTIRKIEDMIHGAAFQVTNSRSFAYFSCERQ